MCVGLPPTEPPHWGPHGSFFPADVPGCTSMYLHTEGFSGPSLGDASMGKTLPLFPTPKLEENLSRGGGEEERFLNHNSKPTGLSDTPPNLLHKVTVMRSCCDHSQMMCVSSLRNLKVRGVPERVLPFFFCWCIPGIAVGISWQRV